MPESLPRVMWLLNHTAARKFEVAMLKNLGFKEIFLPKAFPQDIRFRSASIDASEDASLSIPAADLTILNKTDWYTEPSRDVWRIVNRHFQLIFFFPWSGRFIRSISHHFRGAGILRGYGLSGRNSYSTVTKHMTGGMRSVENMGRRFWLGTAYDRLKEVESPWFQQQEVYLPLGLHDCQPRNDWTGGDARILFVCPDVAQNSYYRRVYQEFKERFAGYPYAIAGTQSIATHDPNILGFVPEEEHQRNMREFRVMFYHSSEPNHVHYHPFEAIRTGMPLVFMAGGMLDRLGGTDLPGRCRSDAEARGKLTRILANDRNLIDKIRTSQTVLLEGMCPKVLEPAWREGLGRVLSELEGTRASCPTPSRRPRVGIVLPVPYRGGTLRSAKLLAQAVWSGSRQCSEEVDVVLAYAAAEERSPSRREPDEWDADLPAFISRRTFKWQVLDPESARRAMHFAGHPDWIPRALRYVIPDDGMHVLSDCALWIIVSDRLPQHLLPIRPYLLVVYDYVQRYDAQFAAGSDEICLGVARLAERVLVTTRFTERDALVYAGVAPNKVERIPMLVPEFPAVQAAGTDEKRPYFLWTTNLGAHKNHFNAMTALRRYYERLDGRLDCRISGVDSADLLKGGTPHLEPLRELVSQSPKLSRRLGILGELPEDLYREELAGASFLWHPARIDNGTLTVVEAAAMGVPSLSSKYPTMEEMNEKFDLNLMWMDPHQPNDMASGLKWMEEHANEVRTRLPSEEELAKHGVERVAAAVWKVVRECL
jgi:glycosyltransferase involved in cell wall biosynthesis